MIQHHQSRPRVNEKMRTFDYYSIERKGAEWVVYGFMKRLSGGTAKYFLEFFTTEAKAREFYPSERK
jgi:hypothetical protein